MAQRLLRRLCKHCARPLTEQELTQLDPSLPSINREKLRTAAGCSECGETGYLGRIGVYSLLTVDENIRKLIREERSEAEIAGAAKMNGFETLEETAMSLVAEGVTSVDELIRVLGRVSVRVAPGTENAASQYLITEEDSEHPSEASPFRTPRTRKNTQTFEKSLELVLDLGSDDAGDHHREEHDAVANKFSEPSLLSLAEDFYKSASEKPVIMLVDCDEGVRTIMANALRGKEYEVVEAGHGLDALQKLGSADSSPTLIVCEVAMPEMDGRELLSTIRRDNPEMTVPVLILTSQDSEELEVELLQLGASDYVRKSSSLNLILSRVQKLLPPTN